MLKLLDHQQYNNMGEERVTLCIVLQILLCKLNLLPFLQNQQIWRWWWWGGFTVWRLQKEWHDSKKWQCFVYSEQEPVTCLKQWVIYNPRLLKEISTIQQHMSAHWMDFVLRSSQDKVLVILSWLTQTFSLPQVAHPSSGSSASSLIYWVAQTLSEQTRHTRKP